MSKNTDLNCVVAESIDPSSFGNSLSHVDLSTLIQVDAKAEQNFKSLFSYFTLIALIIACLGLFGLATFTAEQRTKEIGIRKVLGATVTNIVTMLSKDFLKLVTIASLIAFPIAWFIMNKWLQDFSYRINIDWWVFIAAGISAVLIALLTVSFQAIKAGVSNPVNSLRTE